MGIFKRFKGGAEKTNSSDGSKTGWDNMSAPAVRPESKDFVADAARQQRKILTMYALGEDSLKQVLAEKDVQVDDEARNGIMDMIADGGVSSDLQRKILNTMEAPINQVGPQNISDSLNTKHEKRILAMMGGGDFYNYMNTDGSNVATFMQQYPTPLDFERTEQAFLQHIKEQNGTEKQAEYAFAMEVFKRKVYGKRQEYYEQMKQLEKQANERRERERSAEWIPGDVGSYQISKDQVISNLVSRENIDRGLWANELCEDSMYADADQQVYGVFDGAGGSGNGRYASQVSMSVFAEYSRMYNIDHCSSLALTLNEAGKRVYESPGMSGGCSTGAIAKVISLNGMPKLSYASVGDSRIYIVDKKGEARMITRDEGEGRIITNALGLPPREGESCCKQFGFEDLRQGDRIVICSDGITGDYGDDLMSNEELGRIVHNSHGAKDAAKNLITNARKKDDRTAVVIVPDFDRL